MLRIDQETLDCEIVYGKDSEENTVSILWLIPQYTIITIGEVLNSATAGEFVYTQIGLLILTVTQRQYPNPHPKSWPKMAKDTDIMHITNSIPN